MVGLTRLQADLHDDGIQKGWLGQLEAAPGEVGPDLKGDPVDSGLEGRALEEWRVRSPVGIGDAFCQ